MMLDILTLRAILFDKLQDKNMRRYKAMGTDFFKPLWKCGVFLLIFVLSLPSLKAQFKINIGKEGETDKWLRFITWHQFQYKYDIPKESGDFTLRRSRLLLFGQITKDFMVLTHLGLNNLKAGNLSPLGTGNNSSIFMHGAWGNYSVVNTDFVTFNLGAGLHYYNGISRESNASTLNMMTLDLPIFNHPVLGQVDQFARHLGLFSKGKINQKLAYQLSFNQAAEKSLDRAPKTAAPKFTYNASRGRWTTSGYFQYEFLDSESDYLPYKVGTYLGKKSVFNIGAGYFYHPEGTVAILEDSNEPIYSDVVLWSLDAYYDAPLEVGGALSFYGAFYNYNFGKDYLYRESSDIIGTGNIYYTRLGYLLPKNEGSHYVFMPYFAYNLRDLDAIKKKVNQFKVGINWFLSGHNAKITFEYDLTTGGNRDSEAPVTDLYLIQAHVSI